MSDVKAITSADIQKFNSECLEDLLVSTHKHLGYYQNFTLTFTFDGRGNNKVRYTANTDETGSHNVS